MSEWFHPDIIVQKGMNGMVEIIKKGDKSKAIKKFKCKRCKTVFRTDGYEIGRGTGRLISECPTCNRIAYKCFFN